jgi:prepilin-type N-terminal cleavage/methylation domain-containing protein
MSVRREQGFTLVEVLVAVVVLSIGVLALAGSSGTVNRMIGQGARRTEATQYANRRFELLRITANSTTPRCTALANGTKTNSDGVVETWDVGAGTVRTIQVIVRRTTTRGARADTLRTMVSCS